MTLRYAVANGVWTNPAIWDGGTVPGPGDDVHANGFSVEIYANIEVASLRTYAASPAAAGGYFIPRASVEVCADVYGGLTSCFLVNVPGSTVTLVGNCYGSDVNGWCAGAEISANGTLNIVGNCYGGGTGFAAGCINSNTGTLNVTGNCYGGGGYWAGGVVGASGGQVNIVGNCYGGASGPGYAGWSINPLNIYGEAVGTPLSSGVAGVAIRVPGGPYFVQIARSNDSPNGGVTVQAPGIYGDSGSEIEVGALISGSGGALPVVGNVRVFLRSSETNYVQMRESNAGPTVNIGELTVDYPPEADVRAGLVFAFGNRTGRCAVPPAGAVAHGVPVDATTGTAALTPAALLGDDLLVRLGNCATVQTVGDQLAAMGV